jgi:hypothetical protein
MATLQPLKYKSIRKLNSSDFLAIIKKIIGII